MTIKEIEAQSGMTRANIRFYEAEGLLKPVRRENGYRDYSEQDLEILKRIRLLRTLHISLEEIKALAAGTHALTETLARQLDRLEQDQAELARSREVCQTMRRDGVRYETLDAQPYLDALAQGPLPPAPELEADAIPRVQAPWRRWLARELDLSLCAFLWKLFLLAINVNISQRSAGGQLMDLVTAPLLMLALEPLLLCTWGTTPGKWLLGLRVTADEDRRLTYSEALFRTWKVLSKGMGFGIPIYCLVQSWRSYCACTEGAVLEWEEDSTLILRGTHWRRGAAYAAAWVLETGLLCLALLTAQTPRYRGDLTAAEFCRNFNRLSDYYQAAGTEFLDSTGRWTQPESGATVHFAVEPPDFVLTEEDGVLTSVSFSLEMEDSDRLAPGLQEQMTLAVLSYVGAQEEIGLFSGQRQELAQTIADSLFSGCQFTEAGITVTYTVDYEGYDAVPGLSFLVPQEGTDNRYAVTFRMEKEP